MGNARFIYNNYLTSSTMLNVSNRRTGLGTGALKDGTGSAGMTVSGDFSGSSDFEFTVEVDSTAAGNEVGQATFKYSKGAGIWESSGITCANSPTTISDGLSITFSSGAGADFVQGDRWYFKAVNYFAPSKMLGKNRDQRFRSANVDSTVLFNIDLGDIRAPNAIVIFDHNLTTGASISLVANSTTLSTSTGTVETPDYSTTIQHNDFKVLKYATSVGGGPAILCRYYKFLISDTANPDGFIEIGKICLGRFFEPSGNFSQNASMPISFVSENAYTPYGVKKGRYYNQQNSFNLSFSHLSSDDSTTIEEDFIPAITDKYFGEKKPFFINLDSTNATDFFLVDMESVGKVKHQKHYTYSFNLTEVLRSV
jgi:hypothetical protein